MRASLAVVLAEIWMKSFEERLSDASQTPIVRIKDPKENCPDCHRKIAWNSTAVKCKKSKNCYHINCQDIDKEHYEKFGDVV